MAAYDGDEIVGYVTANRGGANRNNHSAYVVCGIRAAYQNKGLGTRLFSDLTKWADDNKVTRLELTVMQHNKRALALYKKFGFAIEGEKKNSLKVNRKYVDEYFMSRLTENVH